MSTGGKTVKQIADEIGLPKQRVYRYIKRECISEAHQENGVMYYDEVAETLIKQGVIDNTASSEVHQEVHHEAQNDALTDAVIELLQKELEIKNEQIRELNVRLAETTAALVTAQQTAQAAQALHAGTIQQQIASSSADPSESNVEPFKKQGFFARIFRKEN